MGCGKSEKPDITVEQVKVRQVFKDFVKEVEAGDMEGYFSYITDDFLGYDAGMEPIKDRESLRSLLNGFFSDYTFSLTNHHSEEVIVRDDIAIHRHRGTVTYTPKDGTTPEKMDLKYLDILRKNKNGEWKIYIHSASPNQ
jgi:uncharacterized protein (TIGR02246 family)